MFFSIKLDPLTYRKYINALKRLTPTAERSNENMQKDCALEYKQRVAFNIMTQRYGFRAHTRLYREWKQKHFPEYPAFWRLHGDVLRSLGTFKWEDGWMGGIRPGSVGVNGRSVAYYATRVEEGWTAKGGKPRPPRRMFWRTKEDYRKDPNGWIRQGDQALQKIGNQWR